MICSRILSSGDSRWAICGYILSVITEENISYYLWVPSVYWYCLIVILLIIFLLTMQAPWQSRSQGERGRGPYLSPNFSESTLPGCYCWKFAFVSFSEASKINLAPALPESRRGPCIRYLDFLINTVSSLFLQ